MELPQPTKFANDVKDVSLAIVSLLPGGGAFRDLAEFALRKKLERSQALLIEHIEQRGITALTDPQLEFFVPAAYRFYEQARLGEYEHNLKVLAQAIAGSLQLAPTDMDLGKIGRMARKLEMMSKLELMALGRCRMLFDSLLAEGKQTARDAKIDGKMLQQSLAAVGENLELYRVSELLHELSIRGLLTSSAGSGNFFSGGYHMTTVFEELSESYRI